jgi:hypothetical protein
VLLTLLQTEQQEVVAGLMQPMVLAVTLVDPALLMAAQVELAQGQQ